MEKEKGEEERWHVITISRGSERGDIGLLVQMTYACKMQGILLVSRCSRGRRGSWGAGGTVVLTLYVFHNIFFRLFLLLKIFSALRTTFFCLFTSFFYPYYPYHPYYFSPSHPSSSSPSILLPPPLSLPFQLSLNRASNLSLLAAWRWRMGC